MAITAFRTSPDHPVNTMKQIFMDTQEVPVPACLQTAKDELINYMGTVILAFQAYREGEADARVRDLISQSNAQYEHQFRIRSGQRVCAVLHSVMEGL